MSDSNKQWKWGKEAAALRKAFNKSSAYDQYGGLLKLKFEATGFFRTEKTDRWWLVSPEGHAFLGFGINRVDTELLRCKYTFDFWEHRFKKEYPDDELYWEKGIESKVAEDLLRFGFRNLACHNVEGPILPETPYLKPLSFVPIDYDKAPGADDFADVFSRNFERHVAWQVKARVEPIKDDPFLMGYFFENRPVYTEADAAEHPNLIWAGKRHAISTFPRVLRNLGPESAGKQAYIKLMQERHLNNIAAFNSCYGTAFGDFDELLRSADWRPASEHDNSVEDADNFAFLLQIIDRRYKVQCDAIRKADPNHMIFGDILNGNTDTPIEIVAAVQRYTDVVFYGLQGELKDHLNLIEHWSTVTRKAFYCAEANWAVPSLNQPLPFGPHRKTQEKRAEATLAAFRKLFARKDFVGWDWCGWMDQWAQDDETEGTCSGLQTPFGDIYFPMQEAMRGFSEQMYDIAIGRKKINDSQQSEGPAD